MPLTRRELLDLSLRAAALPGAAEFLAAWFAAARSQPARTPSEASKYAPPEPPLLRDYTPRFFDAGDFAALQAFTEILIPTDDTPGAREAHCAHYIDFVLHAEQQAGLPAGTRQMAALLPEWRDAMQTLRTLGFHAADAQGRAALVEAMARPERDPAATHPGHAAYRTIKRLNTFAFYTSRAGLIDALDYRGNSYNATFPACTHPEHQVV